MASTDAIPVPRKNTAYRFYFAIRKPSDSTLITTWAGQDSEVSLDGAAYSDCTNEATEIGTSGTGYIDLTSSEMNADNVLLKVTVTNTGAVPLVFVLYPESAGDYRVSDTQKVDVETIKTNPVVNGGTVTFPTGATLASTTNITAGTIATVTNVTTVNGLAAGVITATSIADDAITAAKIANGAIDAATFAADVDAEILSYLVDDATKIDASALNTAATAVGSNGSGLTEAGGDGDHLTAINLPNQTMDIVGNITGNLSGSVGSVTGAVGSVTGNVGGSVGSISGINFPSNFAALGINASGHVSRVVLCDTTTTNSDMRGTDNAALAATALSTATWTGALATNLGTTNSDLANGGRLDLLIDAIKAKTDSMTFTVAGFIDSNLQYVNDIQVIGEGVPTTDPWRPV